MKLIQQRVVKKRYDLSTPTLHRWIREGVLTEYRTTGGHRRYDEAELEKLFAPKGTQALIKEELEKRLLQKLKEDTKTTKEIKT